MSVSVSLKTQFDAHVIGVTVDLRDYMKGSDFLNAITQTYGNEHQMALLNLQVPGTKRDLLEPDILGLIIHKEQPPLGLQSLITDLKAEADNLRVKASALRHCHDAPPLGAKLTIGGEWFPHPYKLDIKAGCLLFVIGWVKRVQRAFSVTH